MDGRCLILISLNLMCREGRYTIFSHVIYLPSQGHCPFSGTLIPFGHLQTRVTPDIEFQNARIVFKPVGKLVFRGEDLTSFSFIVGEFQREARTGQFGGKFR